LVTRKEGVLHFIWSGARFFRLVKTKEEFARMRRRRGFLVDMDISIYIRRGSNEISISSMYFLIRSPTGWMRDCARSNSRRERTQRRLCPSVYGTKASRRCGSCSSDVKGTRHSSCRSPSQRIPSESGYLMGTESRCVSIWPISHHWSSAGRCCGAGASKESPDKSQATECYFGVINQDGGKRDKSIVRH
jgi:hypothetical protein